MFAWFSTYISLFNHKLFIVLSKPPPHVRLCQMCCVNFTFQKMNFLEPWGPFRSELAPLCFWHSAVTLRSSVTTLWWLPSFFPFILASLSPAFFFLGYTLMGFLLIFGNVPLKLLAT